MQTRFDSLTAYSNYKVMGYNIFVIGMIFTFFFGATSKIELRSQDTSQKKDLPILLIDSSLLREGKEKDQKIFSNLSKMDSLTTELSKISTEKDKTVKTLDAAYMVIDKLKKKAIADSVTIHSLERNIDLINRKEPTRELPEIEKPSTPVEKKRNVFQRIFNPFK